MIIKKSRLITFVTFVIVLLFVFTACDSSPEDQTTNYSLMIDTEGEGEVDPPEGENRIEENSVVNLTVEPAEGDWEFYDWAGEDAEEVEEENGEFKILVDEDKELVAFFADEYYEFEFSAQTFMGASGSAKDLTDNPPYPEGFQVDIEAIPETEEDSFTHWSVVVFENDVSTGEVQATSVDPSDYFEDHESAETKFTVPGQRAEIRPYFTSTTPPKDVGDFDFDHSDMESTIGGSVGDTYHYWDISELEVGEEVGFRFYAYTLPDRFRVLYGDLDDWSDNNLEEIFDAGFVSYEPARYEDNLDRYPGGVRYHDWHEDVEDENVLQSFRNSGYYEAVIEKEADKDVLLIHVTGIDDGTAWQYMVE